MRLASENAASVIEATDGDLMMREQPVIEAWPSKFEMLNALTARTKSGYSRYSPQWIFVSRLPTSVES
ncbi:MAG: hypothetical protein ACON4H_05220 [Rubripirellula sp.]